MDAKRQKRWIWLLTGVLLIRLAGGALIPKSIANPVMTSVPTAASASLNTAEATNAIQTSSGTAVPLPALSAPPTAVNAKTHGAVGDGAVNDTAAIQRALNTRAADVFIPDGTYLVDGTVGLRPVSNQTVHLSPNTILKVIPNADTSYELFRLANVTNVEINGGKLVGERSEHLGQTGEYGMGILVARNASNIRIRNTIIEDFWGDGIYIGSDAAEIIRNVLIDRVVCDNNRRQGLSITNAENVTVTNSIFRNTQGTAPQAGLDIEPNSGCHVSNVVIRNCQFTDNAGFGLIINGAYGQYVRSVSIDSNTFSGNVLGITRTGKTTDVSLIIPAGTTRIQNAEYAQCYSLDRVTIPETVTAIGSGAFRASYSLTSVTIPDGVTTIGAEAFKNCHSLTSIHIPASVTSLGSGAFTGCASLLSAYFHGDEPTMVNHVFNQSAPGFTVYFTDGARGFTAPVWRGYPSATFVP